MLNESPEPITYSLVSTRCGTAGTAATVVPYWWVVQAASAAQLVRVARTGVVSFSTAAMSSVWSGRGRTGASRRTSTAGAVGAEGVEPPPLPCAGSALPLSYAPPIRLAGARAGKPCSRAAAVLLAQCFLPLNRNVRPDDGCSIIWTIVPWDATIGPACMLRRKPPPNQAQRSA